MNYITAKFENSNRNYTFKCAEDTKVGDTVTNSKGQKLEVTGTADMAFVESYGVDKIQEVKIMESEVYNE